MNAAVTRPVLQIDGLDVHYGRGRSRRQVLHGASLTVAAGQTLGLIGETGSGKSTLARAAVGLVPSSAGTIRVDGEEVSAFGRRQWRDLRRRGTVQYVFQDPLRSLDPDLTLRESLLEPLVLQGLSRSAAAARVGEYLARVRLDDALLDRLPGQVSGGQRQRVAVARALVCRPALVVLDEPVSALDAATRVHVLQIFQELRASGVALLFISHDLGSVAGIADRTAVLYQGQIVEAGDTRDVITDPQHPYTRLLVRSAPTLHAASADRAERRSLRALLAS